MTANGNLPTAGHRAAREVSRTWQVELRCDRILFDCDGVLVASTAAGERAWAQWAAEYELEPARVLDGIHGRRSAETVALFLSPERHQEALARIETIEIAGAAHCTTAPGASALLAGLSVEWAVVTSATRALATARLAAAGLPRPPVLVTGDDVDHGKPAPDGYAEAARRLGVLPSACAVVEDSPTGVRAGQAAGARHIIGVGRTALNTPATIVIKDLSGMSWTGDSLHIDAPSLLRPAPATDIQVL